MEALGCQRSSLDPALFCFKVDGYLRGMMACHIDDFLHAGDSTFDLTVMRKLRTRFLAGNLKKASSNMLVLRLYRIVKV